MNIFKKIWNFITGASSKVTSWLRFGVSVATQIKNIADSPILDIIVRLTPTGLDNTLLPAFRIYMANVVTQLNWAELKIDKLPEDEKAIVLHSLSAAAAKFSSDGKLPIQTTLTTQQAIYDEKKALMVN